jgi:uncharacterized protein YfaS (alpha-2-macroglobulin family)
MLYRFILLLFCLFCVVLLGYRTQAGSPLLRVNEATTKILLIDAQDKVSLAMENYSGRSFPAHIQLELLDPQDHVYKSINYFETIRPGSTSISLGLPISELSEKEGRKALLYRLRYRISPDPSADIKTDTAEGLLSLSEITPDIFDLKVTAPEYAQGGSRYRAQVRAVHPISTSPVKNVSLEAEIRLDGKLESLIRAEATTDSEGYATLNFDLPKKINAAEGKIKIIGRRGKLVQDIESDFHFDHKALIIINTDKPLYQPGQVLHVRALFFDSSRLAIPDAEVKLTITDPESKNIFHTTLKTSRFGIASADWPIPENTRLGDYRIKFEMEEARYEDSINSTSIKISRYDLPNFSINIKTDSNYYLPGQNAEVEVRADYLFGQPVTRGHVLVVRESERYWDYKTQKFITTQGEKYEGDIDSSGRFIAHIDLTDEQNGLGIAYSRFNDIGYAAYVTDLTTNRIEQRRFNLRLTNEPIHIYLIEGNKSQAEGMPIEFYLSTFYADGSPAECEVTINEQRTFFSQSIQDRWQFVEESDPFIRKIKTNRYGVAKVRKVDLPEREARGNIIYLSLVAQDRKGITGHHKDSLSINNEKVVRIETDKTLYRAGEPILVELTAVGTDTVISVDLIKDRKIIRSKSVRPRNGRAFVVFPYSEEFKDKLTIAAYNRIESDSSYLEPLGSRSVLYPEDQNLKLDLQTGRSTYRPGEEVRAKFQVRSSNGQELESALGVVVFDRAVEERSRTDQEFAGHGFYGGYNYLLGYTEELSGFTRRDLNRLDLSRPVSPDLELVAEIMLNKDNYTEYYSLTTAERSFETDLQSVYSPVIETRLMPVKEALSKHYNKGLEFPTNEQSLERILAQSGIDFNELRDPWGTAFQPRFSVERELEQMEFLSAGADKRFGTSDDLVSMKTGWLYFRPIGEAINRAAERYNARTGGFIGNEAILKKELLNESIDLESVRDPWGKPYGFEFQAKDSYFLIKAKSSGPDGLFRYSGNYSWDDFEVWISSFDFFSKTRDRIDAALADHFRKTGLFPQNGIQLQKALSESGIDFNSLQDPWGHNYYVGLVTEDPQNTQFIIHHYEHVSAITKDSIDVTLVDQSINMIYFYSLGADGLWGTTDDTKVGASSRVVTDQVIQKKTEQKQVQASNSTLEKGSIKGTIKDPTGAVVAGATIKATYRPTGLVYEAISNENGIYSFPDLPAGFYDLSIEASGFKRTTILEVPVTASAITILTADIEPGGVSEVVTVMASSNEIETTNTQVSSMMISSKRVTELPLNGRNLMSLALLKPGSQISTPRFREYFPETLLWQPSLETDRQGRARLKFKLADNITTWKISVIGSTIDGEIGVAEKEIQAFQPFFVEHDPPRLLTEGDEISLPVVLRNYLNRSQSVNLEIKPEDWFTLLGPSQKQAKVAANDSSQETFNIRATASIKDGKQRITATGNEASDAIEKPVSVHPDGEEVVKTTTHLLGDSNAINIVVPESAIRGTARAELKLYPNLMSHALEGIEGILKRPYGCGEQTISSTYPNLLVLRYLKESGKDSPAVTAKAGRYLQSGYERLLGYREAGGGFSYWGRGDADLALSAYALKFLTDARGFIEVDPDLVQKTREWLFKQQRQDGSWPARNWYGNEDRHQVIMITSYIARIIAASGEGSQASESPALRHALDYLASRINETDEAYSIASFALAAFSAGDRAAANQAVVKLHTLAQNGKAIAYWRTGTNTPFYGWGLTGTLEATALAAQALLRSEQNSNELIDSSLLFLLQNKDRYGVWHSTQATINVLDTLITMTAKQETKNSTGSQAEIIINGRRAAEVTLPGGNEPASPIAVDISEFLSYGNNQIEVRTSANAPRAALQVVLSYYEPWSVSPKQGKLHLSVDFDKTEASVGEEITCKVSVQRPDQSGYGMMLAEIGLPPGAELDRSSLEQAVKEEGWSINHYDVLPDRVVVYLWPRVGGTRFEFKMHPRFGLKAKNAASVLYDYYNPEARAVVAPVKFIVR